MKEYMVKMKVGDKWVEGHRPNRKVKVFANKDEAIHEMFDINRFWVKYIKQFVADMGDDAIADFARLSKEVPSTFGIAERDITEWSL